MSFSSFLSELKNKKILILSHAGADVDGISSAAALHEFLKSKKMNSVIGAIDRINLTALNVIKKLGIEVQLNPDLSKFDGIIVVDTNTFKMFGSKEKELRNFKKPVFVIDHHQKQKHSITEGKYNYINESFVSTTELVYQLFRQEDFKINSKAASLIALGIITDSSGFYISDFRSFQIMAEMLKETKKTYGELLELLQRDETPGEKIAKLKAAQRVKIYKIGELIAVTTNVGSFESDAANALIKLGADIAFSASQDKESIALSGRAKTFLVDKEGFNVAKNVIEILPNYFEGHGGGHAGAAGFNGREKDEQKVLKKCIDLTLEFFKEKNPKIQLKEYNNGGIR